MCYENVQLFKLPKRPFLFDFVISLEKRESYLSKNVKFSDHLSEETAHEFNEEVPDLHLFMLWFRCKAWCGISLFNFPIH